MKVRRSIHSLSRLFSAATFAIGCLLATSSGAAVDPCSLPDHVLDTIPSGLSPILALHARADRETRTGSLPPSSIIRESARIVARCRRPLPGGGEAIACLAMASLRSSGLRVVTFNVHQPEGTEPPLRGTSINQGNRFSLEIRDQPEVLVASKLEPFSEGEGQTPMGSGGIRTELKLVKVLPPQRSSLEFSVWEYPGVSGTVRYAPPIRELLNQKFSCQLD